MQRARGDLDKFSARVSFATDGFGTLFRFESEWVPKQVLRLLCQGSGFVVVAWCLVLLEQKVHLPVRVTARDRKGCW